MNLDLPGSVFNASAQDFEELALHIFRFQAGNIPIYANYIQSLKIDITRVKQVRDIPFLPIAFFKTHPVINPADTAAITFTSSGTTGGQTSRHFIKDIRLYEKSFKKCFELFYGPASAYCILALLPSYLERKDSSLVYMAQALINDSKHPQSTFYRYNRAELAATLKSLQKQGQQTLLIGLSSALAELAAEFPMHLEHTIIMETGGTKGAGKELIKEELHLLLRQAFGQTAIHSEYGMTELLSQAYSKGNGLFKCPPWMKVMIREPNDPFSLLGHERSGGINIIDLANYYSCSFIATQDLGKSHADNTFEVLGRFDNSDLRGCNLMAF